MVEIQRVVAADLERAGDGLHRFFMAAGLMCRDAQQVPGVGVRRLGIDNLAIELFGLGELAPLVVGKRQR